MNILNGFWESHGYLGRDMETLDRILKDKYSGFFVRTKEDEITLRAYLLLHGVDRSIKVTDAIGYRNEGSFNTMDWWSPVKEQH